MADRYYVVTELRSWDITDQGTPLRDTDIVDRLNEQDDDLTRLRAYVDHLEHEKAAIYALHDQAVTQRDTLRAAAELAYTELAEQIEQYEGDEDAPAQSLSSAYMALFEALGKAPAFDPDPDYEDLPL